MTPIGIRLFWCILQATVICSAVLLVCRLLRLASPHLRVGITLTALLMLPMLIVLALCPVPSWFDSPTLEPAQQSASLQPRPASRVPARSSGPLERLSAASDRDKPLDEWNGSTPTYFQVFAGELRRQSNHVQSSGNPWPQRLAWGLAISAMLGGLHLMIALLLSRSIRHKGERIDDPSLLDLLDSTREQLQCARNVELRELEGLASPATLGSRQPVILLPADWRTWTDDQCRVVMAHEVAHIARGDYLKGLVAQACLVLHFCNPFVHWLVRQLRMDQELAADAAAARLSGGPRAYLKTLARMALQHDRTVPWPAHMFLPRRNFLRRIEMLRTWKVAPPAASRAVRLCGSAAIVLLAMLLAGVRSPLGESPAIAQPPAPSSTAEGFDTKYVAEDGGFLIAVRPRAILSQPGMNEVKARAQRMLADFEKHYKMPMTNVDQVILHGIEGNAGETYFTIKTVQPADFKPLIEQFQSGDPPINVGDHAILPFKRLGKNRAWGAWQPDDRTLVVDSIASLRRHARGEQPTQRLSKSPGWKDSKDSLAVVMADRVWSDTVLKKMPRSGGIGETLLRVLFESGEQFRFTVRMDKDASIQAAALFQSEKEAEQFKVSLLGLTQIAKSMLQQVPKSDEETVAAMKGVERMLDTLSLATNGETLHGTIPIPVDDVTRLLAPMFVASTRAAARAHSMNNLKQIGLAMHNFHAVHKRLPRAAGPLKGEGPPVSWRVLLLPYLDQQNLYNQYRFNEPWNSPHNLKLVGKMPPVYRHPIAAPNATSSNYYVVRGKGTMFGDDAKTFKDILDGTSNTVMAVEAKRDIPWTKPEDLGMEDLGKLGGFSDTGYNVGMADGSVRFVSKAIDLAILKSLLLIQDRGIINIDLSNPNSVSPRR